MSQNRERNPNWRGGRSVASNGYVLIRVGKDHHLADVRGYAYEHRIVAEQLIGRRLLPGELVHHINGDKQDNRPENLQVVKSIASHRALHVDELTVAVKELISSFPCTRLQIAEYTGAEPKRIGWALQRLKKRGVAKLNSFGSWFS